MDDIKVKLSRESFCAFARFSFHVLRPGVKFEPNWHIDCVSEHLEAMYRGEIKRLIINMPPRSLKSYLVSQAFPAWVLGKAPQEKFINTSYGFEVAEQNSRGCKLIMESPWYKEVFPETRLGDLNRATHFETTQKGQYYAATTLSPLTGLGCFVAGTLINTDMGLIAIEELHQTKYDGIQILSLNHETGETEYQPLIGFREKTSQEIIEIRTIGGCFIRCTPDHPIFVSGRGYQRADSLHEGEGLFSYGGTSMQSLREMVCDVLSRHHEENKKRLQRRILLKGTFLRASRYKELQEMPEMRQTLFAFRWSILFKRMSSFISKVATENMLELQHCFSNEELASSVLYPQMCKRSAFTAHERYSKPEIQRRKILQRGFQDNARESSNKGWKLLRCLWFMRGIKSNKTGYSAIENESYGASHRREPRQQHGREFNNDVRWMPHNTSQISCDAISSIKRISSEPVKVYDLTIARTHNFFANGVLAHNCSFLEIDDPIKPNEALSDTVRKSTIENIRNTLFSRFDDQRTGKILLIMQRVHQDDPTGALMKDGGFVHLKLPAETKTHIHVDLKTLGKTLSWDMPENSLLFPARLSADILAQLRLDMSEYHYAGQMLQEPVPIGGGEFKANWVLYYDDGVIKPAQMNIAILCDPAGGDDLNKKKKKSSDWTAFMVVGLSSDNNYYLLDIIRDRLNPTERIDMLFTLHRKWNALTKKPPKVGYEKYGLMSDTHYLREKQRQEGYMFPLIELGGNMMKEERIRRLIPDMQNGRWYFPTNIIYLDNEGRRFDLVSELVNSEMASFPRGRFDDMLDSLSRIYDPEMSMIFPRVKPKSDPYNAIQRPEPQGWLEA